MVHVFSGPDHLAAVAPLSLDAAASGDAGKEFSPRKWQRAVTVGFRWGLGHSSGVLFIGLLALLFREILPVQAISSWGEKAVGVMLMVVGFWGLRKCLKAHVHAHEHTHGGSAHMHYHLHTHGHGAGSSEQKSHQHSHAAFAIGTIHGVAGSSHFVGVVPALVLSTRVESISYLSAFGLGTILAMIVFSSMFGWVGRGLNGNVKRYKLAGACTSGAAVLLGMYWIALA
jgi:hypothetical protein